jgi:hypothetical protein
VPWWFLDNREQSGLATADYLSVNLRISNNCLQSMLEMKSKRWTVNACKGGQYASHKTPASRVADLSH